MWICRPDKKIRGSAPAMPRLFVDTLENFIKKYPKNIQKSDIYAAFVFSGKISPQLLPIINYIIYIFMHMAHDLLFILLKNNGRAHVRILPKLYFSI
jgi:hypothetical protein